MGGKFPASMGGIILVDRDKILTPTHPFPDLQHTLEGMIADGDQVAVKFSAQGTHSGPWLDFAATGRSIKYTGVTLARISGDRIIEHHTWWDKAGLMEQITGRQTQGGRERSANPGDGIIEDDARNE